MIKPTPQKVKKLRRKTKKKNQKSCIDLFLFATVPEGKIKIFLKTKKEIQNPPPQPALIYGY